MTEYTLDAEADAVTLAATDEFGVYQASTGRFKKATALEMATYVFGGSPTTGSGAVTLSNNVGTLSKLFGAVTTDSLTQTGQAPVYTATITNTLVTVGDIILASIDFGTNTTGIPVLTKIHAAAGTWTFGVVNAATTATNAFAGTLVINYGIWKK